MLHFSTIDGKLLFLQRVFLSNLSTIRRLYTVETKPKKKKEFHVSPNDENE